MRLRLEPGKCGLLAGGFGSNSVRLEGGARVGQIRAAIYEQRTPLERAAAAVSRALTDEGLMSQEYFEEAEAGASLIAVLAPEQRLVTEARRILAAHGARHMRFYDDNCITDLT
jgi:L-aminopeptidase/D-esterase-like protein